MKILVEDIAKAIEEIAPLNIQEDYDNSGLIVGSAKMELKAVLICTDISLEIIEEALNLGCNLIISHHPAIFRPISKIDLDSVFGKMLSLSIKNNIAWYAAHTNFDNEISHGVNSFFAKEFDLVEAKPMLVCGGAAQGGAGCCGSGSNLYGSGLYGSLKTEISEEELLGKLKQICCPKSPILHTAFRGKKIKNIGFCGGSGGFLLKKAQSLDLDAFVTGELSYHNFVNAQDLPLIVSLGHYESEKHAKAKIYEIIKNKFPIFASYISQVETCPVFYY